MRRGYTGPHAILTVFSRRRASGGPRLDRGHSRRAINASQDAAHAISAANNVTSIAILHFMRPHLLGLRIFEFIPLPSVTRHPRVMQLTLEGAAAI